MRWWTRSPLRAKIFVVFSSLILALLLLTLWFTQLVVQAQVQETLRRELFTTSQVFQELLQERKTRLLTNSVLLASDYALKKVIRLASDEPSSLVPVAVNYQQRIGVDLLWISDAAGVLLADSLERQESGRSLVSFPPVAEALASGEASATITEVDGALVQLVAVPVLE